MSENLQNSFDNDQDIMDKPDRCIVQGSNLLYQMIIDHCYAHQFQLSFSLFKYKETRIIKEIKKNSPLYVKLFQLAEQTKLLYLINYAFIHKDVRAIFDDYLDKELIMVYDQFVFFDEDD